MLNNVAITCTDVLAITNVSIVHLKQLLLLI